MIDNKAIANLDRIIGYLDCMNDAGMLPDVVYQEQTMRLYQVRGNVELNMKYK